MSPRPSPRMPPSGPRTAMPAAVVSRGAVAWEGSRVVVVDGLAGVLEVGRPGHEDAHVVEKALARVMLPLCESSCVEPSSTARLRAAAVAGLKVRAAELAGLTSGGRLAHIGSASFAYEEGVAGVVEVSLRRRNHATARSKPGVATPLQRDLAVLLH